MLILLIESKYFNILCTIYSNNYVDGDMEHNDYQEMNNNPSQDNDNQEYHENEAKDFQDDPTNEVIYEKPHQENDPNMNTDKQINQERIEQNEENHEPINQES